MDPAFDHRPRRDIDDRRDLLPHSPPHLPPHRPGQPSPARSDGAPCGYTLMVAGQRTGKTAFLRLLLDTSQVASTANGDQLASVAKFVQGCAGYTSHIRTASLDIDLDASISSHRTPVTLALVDTPSLNHRDEEASQRVVLDILRYVDSKFGESLEDEYKARTGDHHVHLCIYFLDPDDIVPPSAPTPPVPLVPRGRNNSVSQPEAPPVILEPPVSTDPLLCRPTLPLSEINIIRGLSSRVNVLPVVGRADTLTNERLAAIKMAVRRDLAEAGIGFGIFDLDNHAQYPNPNNGPDASSTVVNEESQPYGSVVNGSASSSSTSSPTTSTTASFLRLPYALIAPDCYSHSDGVNRSTPSRHELVLQYSPSPHSAASKLVRKKFIRSYRWGFLDVLDHTHSDFLPLRQAIFHHMQTLQKYTRDYLLDKFRQEFLLQQHPTSREPLPAHPFPSSSVPTIPPSLSSRPILTIDASPVYSRHPPHAVPNQIPVPETSLPSAHALSDSGQENARASTSTSKSSRTRAKKITVACNFCRSRKLKCDGGRPACHQCMKRNNACDYMAPQKRRGGVRSRRQYDGSDSEGGSGEDRDDPSLETEPSVSPDVPTRPLARMTSAPENVQVMESLQLPAIGKREEVSALPPLPKSEPVLPSVHAHLNEPAQDIGLHEMDRSFLPTFALPPAPPLHSSAPPLLPPIRSTEENMPPQPPGPSVPPPQAPTRKRASTSASAKGNRSSSNYGPKVVACNHCRARKTKCDGMHPTCSSCARRSLDCNYVNDPNGPSRRKSQPASEPASGSSSGRPTTTPQSGPSSAPGRGGPNGAPTGFGGDGDHKREYADEDGPPSKRIRVEGGSTSAAAVAVMGLP